MTEQPKKNARTAIGIVTSAQKMDKTITVRIQRRERHPIYGKYIRRSSKLHAHDDQNVSHMGDVVMVKQVRPYSKIKSWELVEIVEKAQ